MSSFSHRSFSYLSIALMGFVLIALSVYAEFLGVDFGSVDFESYLYSQARSGLWWQTFATPVIAGALFLIMAAFAPRMMQKSATDLPLLATCVLLSGTLALVIKGVAIFALVVSSILTVAELIAVIRQNRSRSNR